MRLGEDVTGEVKTLKLFYNAVLRRLTNVGKEIDNLWI